MGRRRITSHYHIDIFWWPEDERWVANVPDLPGCSAHGATPEEAAREVAVAMGLWLEVAAEHDDPIREASYRLAVPASREPPERAVRPG